MQSIWFLSMQRRKCEFAHERCALCNAERSVEHADLSTAGRVMMLFGDRLWAETSAGAGWIGTSSDLGGWCGW